MNLNQWFLAAGLFLLLMVLGERQLKESPISSAIIYLTLGIFLGPKFLNVFDFNILERPHLLETGAEVVVLISLFSAGLKLQFPLRHPHWRISSLLASLTMIVTVGLIAAVGHLAFQLSWPVAILLGGILAPTDPVLASEVQVEDEKDKDRIRRSLTGEAGLNDGTAFPVVMLGLTLIGARWMDAPTPVLQWALLDLFWAIPGGLAVGYGCGWIAAKCLIASHAGKSEKVVIEDFVSIGLIGASYGFAQILSTYGFLAVFAASIAFARGEFRFQKNLEQTETEPFAPSLIRFSTQLERIGEVVMVVFVGVIASSLDFSGLVVLIPALLIFVIRPFSVFLSLRRKLPWSESWIISWFGIRGVGSIYYLSYAINHGFKGENAAVVFNLVMVTIVVSIFVHGISATPIMRLYDQQQGRK